ncbi:MAG TPA: rod shape-determining protein MreC [Candidatus Sulfotelmatobacter sp.]|nr:rod shape-determining protein MreC [Candidatus Sulfotelmatobacter sp.]
MESVLSRHRNLIILLGVIFLQVLGLAMQVKRANNEVQDTRLIRIWAVGALSPFERGLVWIQNGSANLWHNYIYLRGVRAENRELKDQIEQMRLEQVRLNEDAAQAHRLQTLLAFKEQYVARTVAAQVIGSSGSDLSRVVYIDKGENAGIDRDMAVITANGIVGKVLMAYPSVAQVLLINDQSSGVGAILEKTRLQGVLRGTANGEVALERVMSDEQVAPGETVLTSGGDQIFPKGLPVGTVAKVSNGRDLFLNITIKPAANLSKLEEVLVLVEKQDRQATAEDKGRVRAADILAQRLPSVPDKPAVETSTKNATGSPRPGLPNAAAKPKTAVANSTAQTAKNPAGNVTPSAAVPPKPKLTQALSPKQEPAATTLTVPKPGTQEPAITEEKPATPPAIQSTSPNDDSPH